MAAHERCSAGDCSSHAMQRSLYEHALNALRYAARSGCASHDARELAERCAAMLREAEDQSERSAATGR